MHSKTNIIVEEKLISSKNNSSNILSSRKIQRNIQNSIKNHAYEKTKTAINKSYNNGAKFKISLNSYETIDPSNTFNMLSQQQKIDTALKDSLFQIENMVKPPSLNVSKEISNHKEDIQTLRSAVVTSINLKNIIDMYCLSDPIHEIDCKLDSIKQKLSLIYKESKMKI